MCVTVAHLRPAFRLYRAEMREVWAGAPGLLDWLRRKARALMTERKLECTGTTDRADDVEHLNTLQVCYRAESRN